MFRDKPPTLGSPGLGRKGGLGIHKEEEESGLGGGGKEIRHLKEKTFPILQTKVSHPWLGGGGGRENRLKIDLHYMLFSNRFSKRELANLYKVLLMS